MDKITEKEKFIFNLICKYGITKPKDIAKHMDIPINTVRDCIHSIYKKTDKHSIADLIYHYWRNKSQVTNEIIRKGILR